MKESDHLEKGNTDGRIIFNSGANWIHPAQDKNQWLPLINTTMNFRLSSNVMNLLTIGGPTDFSRTLIHIITSLVWHQSVFQIYYKL
jgi:hypothetical protein